MQCTPGVLTPPADGGNHGKHDDGTRYRNLKRIQILRDMGVGLSVDDFGRAFPDYPA